MKPMLAAQFDESRLRFPLVVQPKLDGIRCIVKDGQPLSRTLKLIPNRHVQELFSRAPRDLINGLDGELMVGKWSADDVYRRTNSAMMSYDGQPDFQFVVFDMWMHDPIPYHERTMDAHVLVHELNLAGHTWVKQLHQEVATSMLELTDIEQDFLAQGYEGAIIRDPKGRYKYGRSTAKELGLMKMKRFEDSEATIIGFEEKMHNANEAFRDERGYTKRSSHQANLVPQNTLGALICEIGYPGFGCVFNIGTGFDDALRQAIWDKRDKLYGELVKFKHFPRGAKEAPRHPVFLGFRSKIDL